ncbi:MAG: Crp/Fnr family transcriptional regulator [Treponemataceae bacterium]|nr:Crp/Fnr family transcriptional regulator [Treponemataceae bacterium]
MLQLGFVNFAANSYILVEGRSDNDRFYIIQKGQVRCSKSINAGLSSPNLGPGDFIGVIPCMSAHNQIENVFSSTPVTLIAVRKDQYPDLIQQNTPVAMKIIRTFANRMRIMNEQLSQLTMKSVASETPDQLYDVAQYYEQNGQLNIASFAYYQYVAACPQGEHVDKATRQFKLLAQKYKAPYLNGGETVRHYPKNTMIFSECQSGSDMFIIQEGQVKITKIVNGNEVILAVLKKGDMFGEMALLENKPRSASAIAFEDCRVSVVNRANFEQMVTTQPQMIARLTTTLADRLWALTRQLENTQIREPMHRLYDMLELQLEKARVHTHSGNYQLNITPYDLARMCGIPQELQAAALKPFLASKRVRVVGGNLFVADIDEVVKSAEFYRRQAAQGK